MATASWGVLRHDKELLSLPLISGIASVLIFATFAVPIALTSKTTDSAGSSTWQMNPLGYVLLFLMYLVLAYVAIFFRAALICGANERMSGGSPTLGSALSGASSRAGKLLPWAVVTATVSVILRSLEERAGFLGRIVIGFVGMAWTVVTFLVLPIVIFEDISVFAAVKKSADMFKRTWGENLILNIGVGLIAGLLMLPAIALAFLSFATGSAPIIIGVVALAVLWVIAVSCWSSAMTAVFQLALYRYATQAPLPQEYAQIDMAHAFSPKGTAPNAYGA